MNKAKCFKCGGVNELWDLSPKCGLCLAEEWAKDARAKYPNIRSTSMAWNF